MSFCFVFFFKENIFLAQAHLLDGEHGLQEFDSESGDACVRRSMVKQRAARSVCRAAAVVAEYIPQQLHAALQLLPLKHKHTDKKKKIYIFVYMCV